jgi:hypothetical protein
MLAAFIAGTASVMVGSSQLHEERLSMSWPSARGTVLKSEYAKHSTLMGPKMLSISYLVLMKYGYSVGGHPYTSDRTAVWGVTGLQPSAREFVAAHPVGSGITVYYNPSRPERAVLVRMPSHWLSWTLLVGGLICLVDAAWCLLRLLQVRKRGCGHGSAGLSPVSA